MELIKKRVHTQQTKTRAMLQIPIEEDINVSDVNPDVARLIFNNGRIKVDEIKSGTNRIWVKGRLCYKILYQSEEKMTQMSGMEGEIPFMEEIAMDKAESTDRVVCTTRLEDMRVSMINSRKLSIQAVISLMPYIDEISEQELCTDIEGNIKGIEYRKRELEYLENTVSKRDLFRIYEECKLPAGMPNIGKVVWKSARLEHVNFRPLADKISVNGDISLFIMYDEESSDKTNWYETILPFSGNIECQGASENMIPDITYETGHEEISVREDNDSEPRQITVEKTLELEINLMNRQTAQIVSDVYGVTCEVEALTQKNDFTRLFQDVCIEEKYTNTIILEPSEANLLQICHQEADFELKDYELRNGEIWIQGNLDCRILYMTNGDIPGFELVEKTYPIELTRQLPGVTSEMECVIRPQVEQMQTTIKDANQVEWRCMLGVCLKIMSKKSEYILNDIKVGELDSQKIEKLPGFVIYFVKEGDSLWQIGKRFYVSVESIKEVNQLTDDEIRPGDRLLIVKSGDID